MITSILLSNICSWVCLSVELLKHKILTEGRVYGSDVLKVDSFLNHRIDVRFLNEVGKEFRRLYCDCDVNKILTVEASGIGIACITAQFFDCPVVFAKKSASRNISTSVYSAEVESFTHGGVNTVVVSKEHLGEGDRVLIIDDFLAKGEALRGLVSVCSQAKAAVVGAGIVIEKVYQGGGDDLRASGLRVESLAKIASMSEETGVVFAD